MFWQKTAAVKTDAAKIDELLTRGVEEVIPSSDSLRALLTSGKQLRIKLGIDPTSPNLHIGRSVAILKLKDFQDLGHHIVFIIGDATGVIGDTSDKESERKMLTPEEVQANLTSYVSQIQKILNKDQMEVRRNSEWLLPLNYAEIGEQADQFSVADFIARENIKKRLDAGKRVSLREVLYPLMQGYDSVAVRADVELGGTDQKFNLLAGRTLQEHFGQKPQHILTGTIISGTDGRKMSSSWGNTINLNDAPNDMFGKVMSIPDELTKTYLTYATRVPLAEVDRIVSGHPKEAKLALARELVRMYHGEHEAMAAQAHFEKAFSEGGVPDDVPEIIVRHEGLMDALVAAKIVASKSDYRRLVSDGAIRVVRTDEKLTEHSLPPYDEVVRIGKHRFVKIVK